jgi:4-amino-4-deoxy-L-arabinose transferase-like glycosyltransferase
MLQRGDWMVPHLAGKPRLQKPPLPYWTTAGLWSLAGHERLWLLRLPVALMGVAAMLLMIDLGRMTLGRLGGLVCGVIWISSYYIVDEYRKAMADPYLAFFTLTAVWAWVGADRVKPRGSGCWRRRVLILIAYVAIGLGALAKGQMIFVHAAMALVPCHVILRRRVRGGWTHLLGIMVMLAIALPWPIYIYRHVPDALEVWKREARGEYATSGKKFSPWYHYLVNLPLTAAPWTIIGAMGLAWPFINRRRRADRRLLWPLAWLGLAVLMFSLVPMKKNVYLLPIMPAQTLLIAAPILAMLRPHATAGRRDAESRAMLNWHGAAAVIAVTSLVYLLSRLIVDAADFGMAFPICSAAATAIVAITIMRVASTGPRLVVRFAVAALLFAISVHIVVGWLEAANELPRSRRIIGFVYQTNQLVRRSPLYSVGGIREDVLYHLQRPVYDLGTVERIPPDFRGFVIVTGSEKDAADARHGETLAWSGRTAPDPLFIYYFSGDTAD